ELVSQIIHFKGKFDPLFHERSKRLGIDLDLPRAAMVLLTPDRKKTFSYLKNRLEKEDLFLMNQDSIVILKIIPSPASQSTPSNLKKVAAGWLQSMKASLHQNIKIGVGDYHPGIEGLAKSYEQASNALKTGMKLNSAGELYTIDDYYLPVFLLKAYDAGMTEGLQPHFEALLQKDAKRELSETLKTIIETNGDMNGASQKLFIHRNTLRYRLDKITEITGKDPRKMTDLLHLYLSYLINELK
ncbi:MAG TPA: hypothetical protein DCR24_13180, partial [Bacillus bacterium]|nr:hypothetical protein [Bacillus sp. (in: firmicutes)]